MQYKQACFNRVMSLAVISSFTGLFLSIDLEKSYSAMAASGNSLAAGQHTRSTVATAIISPILAELDAVSARAEDIYALAKTNKWKNIGDKLELLKKSKQALIIILHEESTMLLPRLRKTIFDLEQAIACQNRIDTMRYSNRITLITTTMAGPLKPEVPNEVALLDYYGRKLEILSEGKDLEKISKIVVIMHLAWQNLVPKLIEKGKARDVRIFSEIMRRLEMAKSPEEYSHLAKQVLVEVDIIEDDFRN